MSRPNLKASFFVDSFGVIVERAKPLSFSTKKRIYERDGGICKICLSHVSLFSGNSVSPFSKKLNAHIDHLFPISRGGQNDDVNLQLLCVSCNTSKGAK